ncbi:HAD family hydrolase [Rhodobacter sp. SY28-1]|uniref:HAD family hydrolase n=1 Tax=Rhodobacter sp. SY28-1 TaxID=2562317 RepID=UPI0010BFB8B0|nr:HAD family hydrolase [Rhodobacter sp. SY28-1]
MLTTIGFDADDTLWQNESYFRLTQERFLQVLVDHADPVHLRERLEAAERRNLAYYGFGVNGFTLSMIETAVEVTEGRVPSTVIADLIAMGRQLLEHPMELLPHARATVTALSAEFRLVLITKGDLLHQERKLAQSGLGDLFHGVEIVSDKTETTYRAAFARHGTGADQAMMVGNSLKSDVIPALQAGSWGVHVPQDLEWAFEAAAAPTDQSRFHVVKDLGELPELVDRLRS